jgi:hypothetical protein
VVIALQLPQASRRRHKGQFDLGAVAVELALVVCRSFGWLDHRSSSYDEGMS